MKRVCLIFLGLFLASSLHAQILPPEGFVAEDSSAVEKNNLSNDKNTGLGKNSIDLITVAQAFHWFNIEDFRKECMRILKPEGKICIV